MENFCIECEEMIEKPSFFSGFGGDSSPPPKKFKAGWMCGYCYQKMRKR